MTGTADLRIGSVEFVGAIAEPAEAAERSAALILPQVAIAGRSNVGKSSLLNRLVGRKRLARTSKRPGRTREINLFQVDDRFLLVDLPGYGYARLPAEVRQRWGPLIEAYLGSSPRLLGLVLLLDARHGPTTDDRQMLDYLERLGLPTLYVLTKVDRVKRSERRKALDRVRDVLEAPPDQILLTSAKTGEGVSDLRRSIAALLEDPESA